LWGLVLLFVGANMLLLYGFTTLNPVTALDANSFKMNAQTIRWCPDAIPDDFVPWLRDPWDKTLVAERGRAVIIVGTESSGSKLAALTIDRMLHYQANSHRLDESTHESKRSFWDEVQWGGHGSIGQAYSQWVVIHRSLPHGDCFPRLESLLAMLGPRGLGMREDRIFVVVATRDRTTTLGSKVLDHQADTRVASHEQQIAAGILAEWVLSDEVNPYVFSYEAFMLLGLAYLKPLAKFLKLDHTKVLHPAMVDGSLETMPALQDANVKWHSARSLWQRAHQVVDYLFNHRAPSYSDKAHPAHVEPPSMYTMPEQVYAEMHEILQRNA